MNAKRHLFNLICLGIVFAFLLAACQPAAPGSPTQVPVEETKAVEAETKPTQPPPPTQKPVSGERVRVEWWFNISNEVDMQAYIAGVDAFNASQDKIELVIVPGQNNDAFLTAISGNKAPDLFITWDGGEPIGTWAQNGLIQPFDDLIDADKFDLTKFHDASVAMGTYEGKVYGIPWQADIVLLFYNKKHFQEAGLDPNQPPKTIAEAIEYGKKLTKLDSNGKITRMGLQPPTWFGPWYSVMAYWQPKLVDMANKKVTVDTPEMIAAFTEIQKLWNIYGDPSLVDEYNATLGNGLSPDDPFLTGKVSMLFDGDWRNGYESRYTDNKYNVDYGMVPIPAPAGMEKNYGASYFFGMNFVMPYNAPHRKEAWEAIKFLTSYETDVMVIKNMWNNPVNKDALKDKELLAMPGMEVQLNSLVENQSKMWYLPVTPITGQLSAAIQEQLDLVAHNKATPAEAVKAIYESVQAELDAITN